MTCSLPLALKPIVFTFALASGALMPATLARAQRPSMIANVPFAFQEGNRAFPAGTYRIDFQQEDMILLRNSKTDSLAYLMTNQAERVKVSQSGSIIFRKYGDQYFLSDLWLPNRNSGRRLPMSKEEKRLRKTSAKRVPTGTQIALNVPLP